MSNSNPLYAKCPSCSSNDALRNSRPRNNRESLIKEVTWFELYRCKKCGWRGFKSSFNFNIRILKKIAMYLLLMGLAAFLVYQVLTRIA